MMADTKRGAHPFAPLVLDDTGSLEDMAAAVMRLHSTLMTVGRCYTTDATGDRAALELGRVESVLAGAFCTIFGQSPADRFADIFDQVTYVADHMVKDHIFEDGNKRTSLVFALSVQSPHEQRASRRAAPRLRCGHGLPVARIESKHPHASY